MIIYAVVQGYGSLMPQIRGVFLKKARAFSVAAEYPRAKVCEVTITEWTDRIIGDVVDGKDLLSGIDYKAGLRG